MKRKYMPIQIALRQAREEYGYSVDDGMCACYDVENMGFCKMGGGYNEWIKKLKSEWVGKEVIYENNKYKVVDVDYNGLLLIDKKAKFTETTAVSSYQVKTV